MLNGLTNKWIMDFWPVVSEDFVCEDLALWQLLRNTGLGQFETMNWFWRDPNFHTAASSQERKSDVTGVAEGSMFPLV